jgi:CubicO group peptidase (beta-lactamase class C family)
MSRYRSMFFIALIGLAAFITAQAREEDLVGSWQGAIEIPGSSLEVEVELQLADEAWQGTIDIPAQGAANLPLEDIHVDNEQVRFAIAGVQGEPVFEGALRDGRIEGSFLQAGQEFPFTLQRVDLAVAEGPAAIDPAVAAEPAPEDVYEDPEGRFTVPVPAGWSMSEEEGYVRLSDPEEGMHLFMLALEEDDLEAAIAEAWERVDPAFDREPEQALEPPSEPGVERSLFIDYGMEEGRIYQALAQLHEGVAYVALIDTTLEAAQRREAQLNIVLTGFRIAALEDIDLTGVEPLPVAEVLPELEAFIEENLEAFGIPGAAVAIVQDGEVVYAEGFGVKEAGGNEPMTADTHMMIGSTGKTMTTMLMAALVDEGLMDWETPAVEILPEFGVADPELTEEITVANLVCACTGVPRRDLELFFNAEGLTAEGIVESVRTLEFFTDFGEAFQYSNQLVATGGYAAAAADGTEFGNLFEGYASSLQERVLAPIGMNNTTLSFEEVRLRAQHATPHQQDLDSGAYTPIPLEVERFLLSVAPAGAHWSTAEDMARYLATKLDAGVSPDGARVVSEENLRATWEPQVPVTATDSYGLGWFVGEYRGLLLLYHGGNTLGFTSDFAFLPDAELGIVVLTNARLSNFFNMAVRGRLIELVFEQPAQAEETAAFGLAQLEEMIAELRETTLEQVDAGAVEPYLGSYTNEALGEITLVLENGRFMMDAGEFESELRPRADAAEESYLTVGAPLPGLPLELQEDEAGEPIVQLGEGAYSYTFTRVE